ncbi:MAG TPA: SDR family NAD(P)-dependent oxidoreductase, partial [Dongiaceae bacterium]
MRGLKGKIAAVTGAASGIGEAAARRLAEEGCKVAILDRNSEGAAAV